MAVRRSFRFVSLLAVLACIGCSKSATPPRPSAPPFTMPTRGDATDSLLRIGDPFPEIQTADLDGRAVTLDKALLGKRCTLIVFWSTWCGVCMEELPHEVELANHYQQAGLRVIGINADSTAQIAKAAARENAITWLNLFEGPVKTVSNSLGIKQWPTLILLGPEGTVVMASPQLRTITAETQPDGSARTVSGLDWALRELLDGEHGSRSE